MITKKIKKQWGYIAITILVSTFIFVASFQFRSVLDGDAMYFLPQIISYGKTKELKNTYYLHALDYSPVHDGRLIWHGFLFQMVTATIFNADTYPKIATAYSVMTAICLAIFSYAIYLHTKKVSPKVINLLLLLLLLTEGGFLIGLHGRPETLSTILLSTGICFLQIQNIFWKGALTGIILGLLVVTSPANAFFAALALAVYWSLQLGFSSLFVKSFLAVCAGGMFTLFVAFRLYPYTFSEWISGLHIHSKTLREFNFIDHWRVWFLYSGHFFMGGIVLVGVTGSFVLIKSTSNNTIIKITAAILTMLAYLALLYYTVVSGWYVSAALLPIFFIISICLINSLSRPLAKEKLIVTFILSAFAISSIDPILTGIARLGGWNGPSLNQSRKTFSTDITDLSTIAFSPALFTLSDNATNNKILQYKDYEMGSEARTDCNYLVIQQSFEPNILPPVYSNYDLYINRFVKINKVKGRLGQWFQPTGFGYAIYKKKYKITRRMVQQQKAVIFYPHIGEYGGIERNILGLATEVIQKGYTPVLVCFYDHINIAKQLPEMEVIVLKDHASPFVKSYRLIKWIKANQLSVLGLPFFFGNKASFYAAIANFRSFVLHYTDPPSLLRFRDERSNFAKIASIPKEFVSNWLNKKGVKLSFARITMTQRNAEELEQLFSIPFEVIYQGGIPPSDKINTAMRCHNNKLRVFSICRLAASKNLEWMLDTVAFLKNSKTINTHFSQIELIIGGKGPDEERLKSKAQQMGIKENVQFVGFLTNEEVDEEYAKADLILIPAIQGYGLPVLEGLYRYVPVVVNKESRVSEILKMNPWAAITENTAASFVSETAQFILRLKQCYPKKELLANLPSEQDWACQIGKRCNWW